MKRNSPEFKQPSEAQARFIIEELLTAWFEKSVNVRIGGAAAPDFAVRTSGAVLLLEFKASSDASAIQNAIRQLKAASADGIKVVVVPYMGPIGRRMCREAEQSWMDLSGNADIKGPGLRIIVEGKPNRFLHAGRPSSVFAPKSSRVARQLLIEPLRLFGQRDLARFTDLDPSTISRVVSRLQSRGLVQIDDAGLVRLKDRRLMLLAWLEDYKFAQHDIVKAHLPTRSGFEGTEHVGHLLRESKIRHAFTGLSAAWLYTRFAGFRLTSVYVDKLPATEQLVARDIVLQEKGSNLWFILPSDPSVYDGKRQVDDLPVAHPVQVWLDLESQPERAAEAAEMLLKRLLEGNFDG